LTVWSVKNLAPLYRGEVELALRPPGTVSSVTILNIAVKTLAGENSSLGSVASPGSALLVVNVASKCGLTPQYTALEKLHEQFASRGLTVVGFPCNQFGGQEPGTADEIAEFCSATYGVTFPMFEKIEVNGPGRHAIYAELTAVPDANGDTNPMWRGAMSTIMS
jgi:glutathione peroxidase